MPSLLEQEIHSQPALVEALLDRELGHIGQIVAALPPFQYVMLAARGSSDHAGVYAKYAWSALAGYPIALAAPSLHTLYHAPPRLDGALVVGVSQSGQSPDIVAVLEEGRHQDRPTIAITNDPASPLASTADHVVELHVGNERSVAATKTYTAQLAVMAAFAAQWSGDPRHLGDLRRVPDALAATLRTTNALAARSERYRYMEHCVTTGRGHNLATALELALKLEELTYTMVTAYSAADFRHGPIATIERGTPAIIIAPSGATLADMLALARDVRERGAELLVISDVAEALDLAQVRLHLPFSLPEWLSPIAAIVPGQIFALHLALARGFDPDLPRGLRKVTRTL
jgi:glucosamine--fructose-6-phosphate aminotransferase (isomerizing)